MADPIFDDTLDTNNLDPENDGAGVDAATLPRKAAAEVLTSDSPYGVDEADLLDFPPQTEPEPSTPEAPETDASSDETAATTEGETPTTDFPVELLNAAGLTIEQARSQYDDAAALAQAVRFLDSRHINLGRQHTEQFQPPATDPVDLTHEEWTLPDRKDGLEWDEDTKNVFQQLSEYTKKNLASRDQALQQQKDHLAALYRQQQAEQQRNYIQEFDAFVNALPPEWAGVLGTGSGFDMNPQSLHFQNRIYLEQAANALAQGRAASGFAPLGRDELLVRALGVAFPDVRERQIKQEVVKTVTDRRQAMINRPTQRRSAPISSDEKAVKTAEAWMKKHGLSDLDDMHSYDVI